MSGSEKVDLSLEITGTLRRDVWLRQIRQPGSQLPVFQLLCTGLVAGGVLLISKGYKALEFGGSSLDSGS